MNWNTIKNCGKISEYSRITDGQGSRITRYLLYNSSIDFIKACQKYYTFVGEFPFIYGERQLNSILLPAFSGNSDAVFLEQPVSRIKKKQKLTFGWIDYWMAYGETVFLIELKHSMGTMGSFGINRITEKKWEVGINQIRNISKSDIKDISFKANKIIKIVLMVMPYYISTSKSKQTLKDYDIQEIEQKHKDNISALNPQPTWNLTWCLHEDLREPQEYIYNKIKRYERYPMMEIFAFIEKV